MSLANAPFLLGAVLAWSLAAPPGPINALMAQASAHRGLRAGLFIGLGAVAGDMTMLLLTSLGVLRIVDAIPWLKVVFALIGAALMLYFAWSAWRTARAHGEGNLTSARGNFAKAYVIVITSPYNWGWWLTAGSSMLSLLGWTVAFGFFVGLILWIVVWCSLAAAGAARMKRFSEFIGYAAAVVLVIFSGLMLWFAAVTARALLS